MACQRFGAALRSHAAGARLAGDAAAHLQACADCQEYLARERRLVAGIARDLEKALQIEPSVQFKAQVRERIAAQTPARRWWTGWRLAVGAASVAAAALLLAIGLAVRTGAPRPAAPGRASEGIARKTPDNAPARVPDFIPEPPSEPATVVARDRAAVRPRQGKTPEPEVLVSADQRNAMARLIDMLRAGRLDEKVLMPEGQQDPANGQPVPELAVDDLNVPIIDVAPATGEKIPPAADDKRD